MRRRGRHRKHNRRWRRWHRGSIVRWHSKHEGSSAPASDTCFWCSGRFFVHDTARFASRAGSAARAQEKKRLLAGVSEHAYVPDKRGVDEEYHEKQENDDG